MYCFRYKYGDDCDWTRNLRSNPMLVLPKIDCWVVIVASQLKRDALDFVNTLEKAARGMRMILPKSKWYGEINFQYIFF